jgi:hypothetical protein
VSKNAFFCCRGQLDFGLDGPRPYLVASNLTGWVFFLFVGIPIISEIIGELWITVPRVFENFLQLIFLQQV